MPGQAGRRMTVREANGSLIVQYDSTRLAKLFLALSAICIVALAYNVLLAGARAVPALAVLSLMGSLVGLVLYEKAQFTFDPQSQLVTWRRRWAWSRQTGTMPFARVKDVLVQSPVGDEGIPSRRLCLQVLEGKDLPLTRGYATDGRDELLHLAGRIRRFVHPDEGTDASRSVAALVRAGHKMEAIRLLRQTRGMSLEEAARRIERIDTDG